jgi:hypothetical protein
MTLIIRQLRAVFTEAPLRQKKPSTASPQTEKQQQQAIRRKSLTVKISKEPPCIVYFERHHLEDSFECIFDPQVHHDEEKDHPDLFTKKEKDLKPWQKAPYCSTNNNKSTFMTKFKSTFNSNNKNNLMLQQSNQSSELVSQNLLS